MPVQMDSLKWLSGTWTGDMTSSMGGRETKFTDSMTGRVALGGRYLILEHSSSEGQGLFALTFNESSNKWNGIWLDSRSSVPTHFEGTLTGSTLQLDAKSYVANGMTIPAMRATYNKLSDTKFDVKIESGEGSSWTPVLSGTYTKV